MKNVKEGIKTTIIGVIGSILSILILTDVIDLEVSTDLQENISAIVLAVFSIISIFSKDTKKKAR